MNIMNVQLLTNLSQHDYVTLYEATLIDVIKLSNGKGSEIIKNISHCLKYRRAYLLPIGADSETIYRQQEIWTYATFTAALWLYCPHNLDIKTIMPKKGLNWLKRYPEIFNTWLEYLTGKENIFTKVVGKYQVQGECSQTPKEKRHNSIPPGKDFFDWVIDCINNNQLQYIHRINIGYFMAIPEAWNAFSEDDDIGTISRSEKLIKNDEGGVIHCYCWGDWKNRHTISGIIIKPDCLPGLKKEPVVDVELTPDPMASLS